MMSEDVAHACMKALIWPVTVASIDPLAHACTGSTARKNYISVGSVLVEQCSS